VFPLTQALNRFEAQTSVPKAYAVLGTGAVFSTFIFFNVFAGFLSNLLGWALPAYLSIKALESPGHDDDAQWLTYWIVFGAFTFLESLSTVLVAWYVLLSLLSFPFLASLRPVLIRFFVVQVPLLLHLQDPLHPLPRSPLHSRRHGPLLQAHQA
jgi:hypothetical protein